MEDLPFDLLSHPVALDPRLGDIARRFPSHRFLGGATQGVFLRQVAFLADAIDRRFGRARDTIRILDWGTGKGHITYLLVRAGFPVTSCDLARDTADSSFGQETPILDEMRGTVVPLRHDWHLPFEDESFSVVVSFGVLEHVRDDRRSMHEIGRVLRPGGIFYISFLPYFLSWTQRLAHLRGNYYHDRLYRKNTLRILARDAGFDEGRIWHGQLLPKNTLPNSNTVEWADRMLTRWTPLRYFATNLEAVFLKK